MTRRDPTVTGGPTTDPNGTAQAATRGEGRFRNLFERRPVPTADVRIVEGCPIIVTVNSEFEARFDVDREVVGESITDCIHAKSPRDEAERIIETIERGEYAEVVVEREEQAPTDRLHCEIIPYDAADATRAFLTYSDATEGEKQEVELKSRNRELEELASILSHDLRNPVNTASGWLDQVDSNSEAIQRVRRSLNRIEAMIDKTLTLTQKPEIIEDTEMVQVGTVARNCWQTVDTSGDELMVDDDFNLLCDETKLRQLLENLFQNAVTHNQDAVTIRIGIHNRMATSTRGSTEPTEAFYISDDGNGIPRENRKQMVEQGKTTTDEGTGLGLTIVQRITEAHGWELEVTETFGGGAKFIFSNATLHGRIPKDAE